MKIIYRKTKLIPALLLMGLILCFLANPAEVIAQNNPKVASNLLVAGDNPSAQEPYAGQALCQPGVYLQDPQDCLVLGPAASLTELAKQGIALPPPPLPYYHTPIELAKTDYKYIRIMTKNDLPVYDTPPASFKEKPSRVITHGSRYFSYTTSQETAAGLFYQFKTKEWVWAEYVARISPPSFEGLIFRETPKISFAWILDPVNSKIAPSSNAKDSGKQYKRFNMVYVYNTQKVGDADWYLIGVDEWVEKRYVAKVTPNPLPPAGVDNQRWIEIDLYQQTLTVYDQGQLVFATLVSTGMEPFWTRPGLFQIYKKKPAETMSSGNVTDYYYLEDVPWTMYFDEERALHGAYWHARFGYVVSHGCVNMSFADAHWLYDWAKQGDWVYVWDPSGQTPTDPNSYTAGGP